MIEFICLLAFSIINTVFFMQIFEDTGNIIALIVAFINGAELFLVGSVFLEGDWKWLP